MAIVASESGGGMSNDAPLSTTRTLDNALGGSGTRTWNNSGSGNFWLWQTGSSTWVPQGGGARALVTLDGSNYRISFQFKMSAGSALAWGLSEDATQLLNDGVAGLLVSGLNSLRLREYPSTTDHDTQGFSALSTGTWYTARFTRNGSDFLAEILNAAADTLIADVAATVSGQTGTHYGWSCSSDGSSIETRNFVVEDVAAGSTDLTPTGITASPVVGAPVLSKQLAPTGVTSSPVVGQPALGPRAVYVTGQAGGSGTASADLAATVGVNRVEATLMDAGTNSVLATKREDVDPSDTVSFSGVSAGSRKIRLRDVLKATVAGITVAAGAALVPVGITSAPTVGVPALGDGSGQTMTVAVNDTLASGARTLVPFKFNVPLQCGSAGLAASGNTLAATVGGNPQAIGVAHRCSAQSSELTSAVVAGVLDALSSGGTASIVVSTASGSDPGGTAITWADILATGWKVTVEIDVSGTTYTADLSLAATSDTTYSAANPFYHGTPIATGYYSEVVVNVPFKDDSNNRVNDKLRLKGFVGAWKSGSSAVGGGNPILAIRAQLLLMLGSWNGAVSSVTVTAIRIKNHTGTTLHTFSGSPSYVLYPYGTTNFGLPDGVWWSNTSDRRDGWEVVHETVSNKLEKFIDNRWVLPNSWTSAMVDDTMDGYLTTFNGQSADPMQALGAHEPYQPGTGSRADISIFHLVSAKGSADWGRANARAAVRKHDSTAFHIPYWRLANGLLLDIDGTHAGETDGSGYTAPTGTASPVTLDIAHGPFDGFLSWLTTGDTMWLELIHAQAISAWAQSGFGNGLARRLAVQSQPRGAAWSMRSVAMAIACTPNGLAGTITGVTRADLQGWLDAACGTNGGTNEFGLYTGAKNCYWDTSQSGAVPLGGWFDNDDAANQRMLFRSEGATAGSFEQYFVAAALAQASWNNVLNADGVAFRDWVFEMLRRDLSGPWRDLEAERYFGRPYDAHAARPKTKAQHYHDLNSSHKESPGTWWVTGSYVDGLTGYTINAANPAAVTITLLGASCPDYFDDGESGAWFKGTSPYNGRGGAAWVQGSSPNNWSGKVTAVSGKVVTIDCTVATGVAPSSSPSNVDPATLGLPACGPNSAWNTGNVILNTGGTNDYTWSAKMAVELINIVAPPADMSAIRSYIDDRLALRGQPLPLDGSDNKDWAWGDWS